SAYKSKFSLSYTGYQQDARRLGGPVTNSYTQALRVGSKDDIGGVHLRGTIKDFYNGFIWDKSDNKTLKFKDKLEVKEYNMGYLLKEMEIVHEGVKTTTAFNALYPLQLTNSWKYAFIDSDLEIFNPKTVRSGKSYSVKFKEYNIDQATILDKGVERIGNYDASFSKYLELPNEIPSRVYDLTEEITNKYKSPYMKASAIEDFLRKNFPYSKDTSILPEGRDFVDYFIFDEKKGSCSYYATALAVMARIVDIPSRYVEGFVVPYSQSSDGYREILNSDAHAWVEIYLDGVGWVTFDPTPGNTSLAYQFPQDSENNSQTQTGNNVGNDNTDINEDDKNQNEENPDELDGVVGNVNTKTPLTYTIGYILLGIFGFGLLLVLASLAAYILINSLVRRNIRIVEFSKHKMILFGKLTYIPYAGGETLREYLEVLAEKLQINLEHYILVYEKVLYSKHKISTEEQTEIIDTMLGAKKKVMERSGRMRFFYSDYIDTLKFYILSNKKSK
ncbi:MAG: transglutaminase domain protein, partial [Clostridiales bacterium]|nr:transglutaminase domain protein [Clostridiales bacterium]